MPGTRYPARVGWVTGIKRESEVGPARERFAGEKRLVQSCVTGGQNPRFTQSVSHQWFENRGFTGEVAKPS